MKKAKRCLIAVVSGVLVATAVLSGCGQSKKEVSKASYRFINGKILHYIHELSCRILNLLVAMIPIYTVILKNMMNYPDIITVHFSEQMHIQPYLIWQPVQYYRIRRMKSSGCQSVVFKTV